MKGSSAIATKDIQTSEGMLHKNTEIQVIDIKCSCTHGEKNIVVRDNAGREFWVGTHDILIS